MDSKNFNKYSYASCEVFNSSIVRQNGTDEV